MVIKRYIWLYAIIIITLAGCGSKSKPVVIDPCANASVCWGKAGESPDENSVCKKLTACYDWEIRKR